VCESDFSFFSLGAFLLSGGALCFYLLNCKFKTKREIFDSFFCVRRPLRPAAAAAGQLKSKKRALCVNATSK